MSGIAIITISNNVLLIVLLFLHLFRGNEGVQHAAWVGGLTGVLAMVVLVLYVIGVLAQDIPAVVAPIIVAPVPTFADQIVPIAVAVATAIGIIMAAVLPAIAGIRRLIADVKDEQKKQGDTVGKLEINTNSIRDALVKATRDGALAQGKTEGRAALKAEQDAATVAAMPTPVEIVNLKPVPVTELK